MGRMPGADWQGEQSPRSPMARYDIVCIHTIVGYAPAHAAHFSTKADGTIIQSRDTAYRSAANLEGNHRVIAIENEDHGPRFGGTPRLPAWVPLTPEQVQACARILAWAHKEHGVPLQLCPDSRPGSRGLAYHRQGIDGNFGSYRYPGRVPGGETWTSSPGKVCPTDVRIAQLPEILAVAKAIVKPRKPVRFVTANMNKDRGGDKAYTRHLLKLTGRGVLLRQEVGHGLTSTRIRGVRVRLLRMPKWVLGRVGVHRGVARATVRIDRRPVRVLSVHGLHLGTSGRAAQDAYYARLKRKVGSLNRRRKPWVVGGDFNRPVAEVARLLGGKAHGDGVDGFIVRGLHVTDSGSDDTGIRKGWTDHPARWIDVSTTKES